MKKLMGVFILYSIFGTNVSYGLGWSDFDPTYKDSSLRKGLIEMDPTAPNSYVGKTIRCVPSLFKCIGKGVAEGAIHEVEKAGGRIIDEKVKPLVEDVNIVMKQRLEQIEKMSRELLTDADEKVKNRLQQVDEIINKADQNLEERLDQAGKIVTQLIGEADERTKQRLTQLDHIIKTSLKEVNDVVDKIDGTMQHAFDQFDELMKDADKITTRKIREVQQEIISYSFSQLDEFRKKFRQDVAYFFDRTEYIIETVDCKVAGTIEMIKLDVEQMKQEMANLWPRWCLRCDPPYCYSQLGITERPQSFEYATIYDLKKCQLLNSLKPEMPIRRIKNAYLDLKTLAAKMMCVQRQAGTQAKLHYTWDWLEFGKQYDFWATYARN